jgi:F-box associated protein
MNINSMPDEIVTMIFNNLPLQGLVNVSETCSRWKVISSDQVFWEKFNDIAGSIFFDPYHNAYGSVKETVKNSFNQIKKLNTEDSLYAHLMLSKLGFRSLEEIKKMASNCTFKDNYAKDDFYYSLAFACLNQHPLELNDIILKMFPRASRGVVAFVLCQHYLKSLDFTNYIRVMKYINFNQIEWEKALFLLVDTSYKTKQLDIVIQSFQQYQSVNSIRFYLSGSIRVLTNDLMAAGEHEASALLRSQFSFAFDPNYDKSEIEHYIGTGQLKRAEEAALEIHDLWDRHMIYQKISRAYELNNNSQDAERIESLGNNALECALRMLNKDK